MGDGNYCYYGLENALIDFLISNTYNLDVMELIFNIDDLPLTKSSTKQVWQILGNVFGYDVFMIGVYEGYSKPCDVSDFLKEFVDKVNYLIEMEFLLKINILM